MASGEVRRRPRLIALLVALAAVVLVADQVSKQVVLNTLVPGEYHPLIGDFFGLSLVFNPGAAFSLGEGATWLFTVAMVVVSVVIVVVARRLASLGWAVTLGVLLGGTLGNLGDRLFRDPGFPVGHVVDFLNYNGWFVGNVADIAIVLSAAGIAVLSFTGIGVDGRRGSTSEDDGAAAGGRHVAEDDEGDLDPSRRGDGAGAGADSDEHRADSDGTAEDEDPPAEDDQDSGAQVRPDERSDPDEGAAGAEDHSAGQKEPQ